MHGNLGRLDNSEQTVRNAHFLGLVGYEAAYQIHKWRAEATPEASAGALTVDASELTAVLERGDELSVDPYLIAFVVMGVEWLFRAQELTTEEVGACQSEMEEHVHREIVKSWDSEEAVRLLPALRAAMSEPLQTGRYLVSLGKWGTAEHAWRRLRFRGQGGVLGALSGVVFPPKRGRTPRIGAMIAGLIVEGLAESECGPHHGSKALGMRLASVLRGRKVQNGEFGLWRRCLSVTTPGLSLPTNEGPKPVDMRSWLIERSRLAYDAAFYRTIRDQLGLEAKQLKRDWAGFLVEVAHNPLAMYGPLVNPEALTRLYATSWRY